MIIVFELTTPEAFDFDWYGWITNQMGHSFLGVALALIFSRFRWQHIWVIGYLAVEVYQFLHGGDLLDGMTDTMFVAAGAAIFHALKENRDSKAAIAFMISWVALFIGVWVRL